MFCTEIEYKNVNKKKNVIIKRPDTIKDIVVYLKLKKKCFL